MPPTTSPTTPPLIPDYELLRPIGRGSYGEVWLARSVTGVFRVIKVVRRDRFEDERPYLRELEGISRFQAAASGRPRQLALLHVGRNDAEGYFYYVMEPADDAEAGSAIDPDRYVPLTLKELFARRGRLPATECIQLALELARGLAILHGANLIHRDIKPSNIIFVQRVPKLADVGLVASSEATMTCAGTPGYAPREGAGTVAADIFSLGKVLYEIATGLDRMEYPKLPADIADGPDALLLREINSIVLRACHHDPEQRHTSAEALARDLEIVQAGRSVALYEALRKKLKAIAIAAALVAVLAGSGAAMLVWRSRVLSAANHKTRLALYRSDISIAQLARSGGDLGGARAALQRQIPKPGETDLRGPEWNILAYAVRGEGTPLESASSGAAVQQIVTDPSGRWAAASFADDHAAIWDLTTLKITRRLDNVRVLGGFTQDGLLLVDETNRALRYESPTQGTIRRWETGQRLGKLLNDDAVVLLPPTEDLIVEQFSPHSATPTLNFNANLIWTNYIAGSLDVTTIGSTLAIGLFREEGARRTRTLAAVDFKTSEVLWSETVRRPIIWIRWSPDGQQLLANIGGLEPSIYSRKKIKPLLQLIGHTARVNDAAFSHKTELIATAGSDQTIRIWNSGTAEPVRTYYGVSGPATAVAWLASDSGVLAGDDLGDLRLFAFPTNRIPDTVSGVFSDVHGDLVFSSDGASIAVTATSNSVRVFAVRTLALEAEIQQIFQPVAFNAAKTELIAFRSDWSLVKADLETKEIKPLLPPLPTAFAVRSWAIAPEISQVLMAGERGEIALIDWERRWVKHAADPETNAIWAITYSPSQNGFLTGTEGGTIRLWTSHDATQAGQPLQAPGDVQALAASADGRWLASSLYSDASIRVLDRDRQVWLPPLVNHRRFVQSVFFTGDGKRLVSAGADGRITIWRVPEFEEVATLEINPIDRPTGDEGISIMRLSENATVLGALTEDGRLQVWRTE